MQPKYVLINRFADLTGYSEKAVRKKIEDGKWKFGIQYRKAPDGHIMINLEEYEKWVEQQATPKAIRA